MRAHVLEPNKSKKLNDSVLSDTLRQACKKIAPVWPLENFVAVNPYLGLTDMKFEAAAQLLSTVGGIQMSLPLSFYRNKLQQGKITPDDIKAALSKNNTHQTDPGAFISTLVNAADSEQQPAVFATLVDVATLVTEKDWTRFFTSRVSVWAASYFDNGQASWVASDQKAALFQAWKTEAGVDLTPEISGLKNFRKLVKALPDNPLEAVQTALSLLGVPQEALPVYLHRLLVTIGGWSAYAARLDWDSELYGRKDGTLLQFLAVLICWEACLLQSLDSPALRAEWAAAIGALSEANTQNEIQQELAQKLILQDAFELATQREIIRKFEAAGAARHLQPAKLKAQAIFCIDVRSEVFRRKLEEVDQGIDTLGFAGFFAFPVSFIPIAHHTGEAQCPVLIKTGPTILEEIPDKKANSQAYKSRVLQHQVQQLWKSFKSGAITCFSFVSPIGLFYLPKLFTDSFGLTRPVPHPDKTGLNRKASGNKSISLATGTYNHLAVGMPLEQRVQMASNALKAMSLTHNFADFVLIVGHGATTVNNPYASGLDCGACGGHSGEANAKVAAAVLNDKAVRIRLKDENISIPDSTLFLACLHDTTTDEISILNEQQVPECGTEALVHLKMSLAKAGQASRAERALRMHTAGNIDIDVAIKARSKDWSQVRPEWGLAGCSSFVVAPRERTRNIDFGGQAFLHSYEWKKDKGFPILELIMTAPMVVTSWISLQYYASTVDNRQYGSGNKTLHNITAGVGVLEGFSGDLRVGLPLQSVHDGQNYQHEPVKLNVIIEAPIEAINSILVKHQNVRNLCENGWLYLLVMNEQGKVSHRYDKNLNWEALI